MEQPNHFDTAADNVVNRIITILVGHLRGHALRVILFGTMSVLIGIAVALMLGERFRSYATILPPSGTTSSAGISQIAALAGINLGSLRGEGGIDMQLLLKIGESDAVLRKVILKEYTVSVEGGARMNLIDFWKIKGDSLAEQYETALIRLRDEISFELDKKTQLLKISIATRDRQLSADIIRTLVESMDTFLQSNRRTNAGEQKRFIENRLSDVTRELRHAEEELRQFREKNRIATSPELQLDLQRLVRSIEIANTLYVELRKQYEITRIEEVKDIPIINVMDQPVPQILREYPRRKMVVAVTAMLLCVGYVAVLLFRHLYWDTFRTKVQSIGHIR